MILGVFQRPLNSKLPFLKTFATFALIMYDVSHKNDYSLLLNKRYEMSISRMSKVIGVKGYYLSACKSLKINPIPIKVPIFGTIRTYHEIRNLHDNFGRNALRDQRVESYLSKKQAPCVIDCDVNVGVTVRWWFYLNNRATVFGIDMIKEAHEFTIEAVKSAEIDQGRYRAITAALWSESGKEFRICVNDPLLGDNSLYREGSGQGKRVVISKTLDEIFNAKKIDEVNLLKIDLEGAGADTLKGAGELLEKTKHIVFEIHNEEECKLASKLLVSNGFLLRKVTDREHLWWEKEDRK